MKAIMPMTMRGTKMIIITITNKNSNAWVRVAARLAQIECEKAGLGFLETEILVKLPEQGRCFTKSSGRSTFQAHG